MTDDERIAETTNWRDVMPGWDSLAGQVITTGRIRHGRDAWPVDAIRAKARRVLAKVTAEVAESHGVSTALVAIVTILHPLGEWRMGGLGFDRAPEPVLAKLVDGEVMAMIAPVRRESHPAYERSSDAMFR